MTLLTRRSFLNAILAGPGLAASVPGWAAVPDDKVFEALLRDYRRRHAEFARQMENLAAECDRQGFSSDAAAIRELARPVEGASLRFEDLPETVQPEISRNFAPAEREWRVRLRTLQREYAAELYAQSNRARQRDRISFAYRLIQETAFHDPDHAQARAILGYVKVEERWTTPFRRQMQRAGKVWHKQYGWLAARDVPRYEAGERFFNGRWMAAQREEAVRSDFRHAWESVSEHFEIHTNESLERAVEISVALERFHEFFVRTFAPVFLTPPQLRQLFEGGLSRNPAPARRMQVHYYRTQQEFVSRLRSRQPEVEISNGLYMPDDFTSYFFHRPEALEEVEETMYHETTHQILSANLKRVVHVGEDANFWIVEGLACYLESFKPEVLGGTVGDPGHIRIAWARKYLTELDFFVPLERFTSMGQRDFQCAGMVMGPDRVLRLQQHYAQAAGVTHFLMHGADGEYRDALITYLSQVYHPDKRVRERTKSIAELTGLPFAELDRLYVQHLNA